MKIAVIASAAGDIFSECLPIFGAAFIAIYTARIGPPEIFAVYCTAFVIIGSVIGASSMRGLISTVFGILLSIIGLDPISSLPRLTFEINMLEIGKGLVPVL